MATVLESLEWKKDPLLVYFFAPDHLDPHQAGVDMTHIMSPQDVLKLANIWHSENQSIPGFKLTDEMEKADIRVTIGDHISTGSWSMIGHRADLVVREPTMCIAFIKGNTDYNRHIVLHQFGHALGMVHEHQRSEFWKHAERFIDFNMMERDLGPAMRGYMVQPDTECSKEYDPESIMHYWFSITWIKDAKYHTTEGIIHDSSLTDEVKNVLLGIHKRHLSLAADPSQKDVEYLARIYCKEMPIMKDDPSHATPAARVKSFGMSMIRWVSELFLKSPPNNTELNPKVDDTSDSNQVIATPKNWSKGRFLGSGASGKVYVCKDNDVEGRELAVKIIKITDIDNAESSPDSFKKQKELMKIERELKIMQSLRHERIVSYMGAEEKDGKLHIFMELMPAGSLTAYISANGALDEILTRKYTRQILEGVSYLHENKVVHRDIKGANILIDSSLENIKLADFGASNRIKALSCKTVVGTPYWMAPEVIRGYNQTDRVDIWSIGATVVEMLTCKPPWYELEAMQAIFKIASEETRPVLPSHCSEQTRSFIQRCFIKDPTLRPSAQDLMDSPFVTSASECT